MRTSIRKSAENAIKEMKRRRYWSAAIGALSIVVVVATVWALMAPARALVGDTYCGKEEHIHGDECYETVLICGYEEAVSTTDQETAEAHRHDESCYEEVQTRICGKEESEGHVHTDDCYTLNIEEELVCGQEESEEHTHTEECYIRTEERILSCGQEEEEGHTHTDECYETERVLVCGKEESEDVTTAASGDETAKSDHVHTEACYGRGELICEKEEHTHDAGCHEKPVFYCGEQVHVHTDNCYDSEGRLICGQADFVIHTHTEECYSTKGQLICPLPEIEEHVHTEACYVQEAGDEEPRLICGKQEAIPHVHTSQCLDEDGWLICGKLETWEHVHGAGCFIVPEEAAVRQSFGNDGFAVTAVYGKDAQIPDRAVLLAERITEEEEELYTARRTELTEYLGEEAAAALDQMYRIGFYIREERIEPKGSVVITLQLLGENALDTGVPVTVIGFNQEGGAEKLDAGRTEDGSITFRPGEFSEFAFGYEIREEESPAEETEPEETETQTGAAGPKLPVIDDEIYPLSYTYEYGDQDLQIRFYVEGNVILPAEVIAGENGLNEEDFVRPGEDADREAETKTEEEETTAAAGEENDETTAAQNEPESSGENGAGSKDAEKETTAGGSKESPETEASQAEQAGSGEDRSAAEGTEAAARQSQEAGDDGTDSENPGTEPASADGAGAKPDTTKESASGLPAEESGAGEEPAEETVSVIVPTQEEFESKLEFRVRPVDEQSAAYAAVTAYEEEMGDAGEELLLQVLSYSMNYAGYELDLSNCSVVAEILPTKEWMDAAKEAREAVRAENEPAAEDPEIPAGETPLTDEILIEAMEVQNGAGEVLDESDPIPEGEDPVQDAENGSKIGEIQVMSLREDEIVPMMLNLTSDSFAVRATGQPNPSFSVQYYADLEIVSKNGVNGLPMIDTSGGDLPKNGSGENSSPNGNPISYLYLDANGNVLTDTVLTEVYEARNCEYIRHPTINYFDALRNKPGYSLREVWVLKDPVNMDPKSVDPGDWNRYRYSDALHFTNREVSETAVPIPDGDSGQHISSGYVYIADNAVLRLVYDVTTGDPDFAAGFYDYDISDGNIYKTADDAKAQKNPEDTGSQDDGKWYAHTAYSGINDLRNYTGIGAKLAFGNANTGTGLQYEEWNDKNLLNKLNAPRNNYPVSGNSYKGCAFGLAVGLSESGEIQYNGGLDVPNLFNEGSAVGKTSYEDGQYSLKFIRSGDTYTLSAVNGTGATGLESFSHPGSYTNIWTNHFWPMDSAGSYGTDGHDMKAGSTANTANRNYVGEADSRYTAMGAGNFPPSDDGQDHNNYFGMRYAVGFELSEDYVGPLEYYFFGDDDMWVFLSRVDVDEDNNILRYYDSQLVCDLGGTHSSVGEYVNLWDYMKEDHTHTESCYGEDGELQCNKTQDNKAGKWALTFYYTERGASGSTCWMQFTLPSATSLNPETTDEDYGELKVEKTVTAVEGDNETIVDNNDEFTFRIELKDAAGNNLPDDYAYVKYDKNGNDIGADLIIWDGAEFTLKNGEYIIIRYLPQGTRYTITETDTAVTVTQKDGSSDAEGDDEIRVPSETRYLTDISIDNIPPTQDKTNLEKDKTASGTITQTTGHKVHYNNKFYTYALPETGGFGEPSYTMAGIGFMLIGGLMYKKTKSKERKRRTRV